MYASVTYTMIRRGNEICRRVWTKHPHPHNFRIERLIVHINRQMCDIIDGSGLIQHNTIVRRLEFNACKVEVIELWRI